MKYSCLLDDYPNALKYIGGAILFGSIILFNYFLCTDPDLINQNTNKKYNQKSNVSDTTLSNLEENVNNYKFNIKNLNFKRF